MQVYHGSHIKVDKIDLSKCKPNKDFGKGFYVTKFRNHAEEWAKIIGEKYGTDGFVSEFEFSENDFTKSICKIKRFDVYDEKWLDFIVENRDKNSRIPAHDYDIVTGPVADDKIQNTLRLYLKGKISKEKFLNEQFGASGGVPRPAVCEALSPFVVRFKKRVQPDNVVEKATVSRRKSFKRLSGLVKTNNKL